MIEKIKKNWKKCVLIFIIVIIVIAIAKVIYDKLKFVFDYNVKNNEDFYIISFADYSQIVLGIISIVVIGVGITILIYFLTKKDNKIEKQKEIIEKIINKIQEYINDNEIIGINEEIIRGDNLTLNLKLRKINNHIKYLEKFANKFDYKDLINNVNNNFHEYKEEVCKMKEDSDFVKKSFNNLTRIIHLIDDGLEEILVKIYE